MKITNSITTAASSPEFYAQLRDIQVGQVLKLDSLIPALDARVELTCTDKLLTLYTFTVKFMGVAIGAAKILDDQGVLAINWEEL